jgi:hypothetical protein
MLNGAAFEHTAYISERLQFFKLLAYCKTKQRQKLMHMKDQGLENMVEMEVQ